MRSISPTGGLGLLLITVGIAYGASVFFDPAASPLESHHFRTLMLAIALTLAVLGIAEGRNRRPAMIDLAIIGAGLLALWQIAAGANALPFLDLLHPWTGLLGCAAVLLATWRLGHPWLALAAVLAIAHLALPTISLGPPALQDTARQAGEIFWFDLEQGALGWVFDILSSWGLLVFLLGGMLAGRLPSGVVQTVCRFLVPPLAIGALVMLQRPGVDPIVILPVMLATIGIGLVWFRLVPARAAPDHRPAPLLDRLAETGAAFGRLLIQAGAIGMVLAALDRTGLPLDIAQLLAGGVGEAWLPLSLFAAAFAAGLGIVMPGVAAYLIAAALLAPGLRTVGLDLTAAHLLILPASAIASAIAAAQAASASERRWSIISGRFGSAAFR